MALKQIRHSHRENWWTGKSVGRKYSVWNIDTMMENTVERIKDKEDKVKTEVLERDEREEGNSNHLKRKYLRNFQNWLKASHSFLNPWEPQAGQIKRKLYLGSLPTQEMRVQSLVQEDSLEKEMATHSSILAWKIPWTEEAGGLQFMGSQKSHSRLSD